MPADAQVEVAEQFRRARERYVMGDVDVARSEFLGVLIRANAPDADVPFEIWAESWIYLGEIQLLQGRRDEARAYFSKVLA
ncbi:MAG: tetratricopeptide repeat protein, partial [Myxococcales bacterium]|nr:tetratricopeptide repeat protein [Myxococcales bacterium]